MTVPKLSSLALVGLAALALASAGGARPGADDPCLEPGEMPVHLTTSDGASIYGVEVGTGTTGVVLGHQYLSDHCEFMDFARELAGRGYRALSIDFRYYGQSRGGDGRRLDLDVAAAVARLRADGATRVKLVGASMGGTAVVVAGSWITPAVDGVVSLSGPAQYRGLNALNAVRRLQVPVRFVVSRVDRPFASDAVSLVRATAAKDKAIFRLAGALHGSSMLERPAAHAFVLAFLAR